MICIVFEIRKGKLFLLERERGKEKEGEEWKEGGKKGGRESDGLIEKWIKDLRGWCYFYKKVKKVLIKVCFKYLIWLELKDICIKIW